LLNKYARQNAAVLRYHKNNPKTTEDVESIYELCSILKAQTIKLNIKNTNLLTRDESRRCL
jgi:hypothetical protein